MIFLEPLKSIFKLAFATFRYLSDFLGESTSLVTIISNILSSFFEAAEYSLPDILFYSITLGVILLIFMRIFKLQP